MFQAAPSAPALSAFAIEEITDISREHLRRSTHREPVKNKRQAAGATRAWRTRPHSSICDTAHLFSVALYIEMPATALAERPRTVLEASLRLRLSRLPAPAQAGSGDQSPRSGQADVITAAIHGLAELASLTLFLGPVVLWATYFAV